MMSLHTLLEDISDFRKSLNDKRFDPFTDAQWKEVVKIMNNPSTPDDVKEKIKKETVYRNLRLIVKWWFGGFNRGFSYVDEEEYVQVATDAMLNMIESYDYDFGNKYGAYVKRGIKNALINLNKKNEKRIKKTTSLDAKSSGKEGSEMDRYDALEKSMIKEPELNRFMNDPEFVDRVNKLKQGLSRNQKFVMSWILHPNFADIRVADIVKAYNDNLPAGEKPLTNQTLNQAKYVVMDLLLNDKVIKKIIN